MTTVPTTLSDEEIIKRLQIVMRDLESAKSETSKDLARIDGDLREVGSLTGDLAARIHAEPERWGVHRAPMEVRSEAASDALVALLRDLGSFRGQQSAADWFASLVRERAAELQELRAATPRPVEGREELSQALPVFDGDHWRGFEGEFPADAFALRLRYLLNRTLDEMAPVLDVTTPRGVTMRLNRARDRFQRYCREAGADAREAEQIVQQLGEG